MKDELLLTRALFDLPNAAGDLLKKINDRFLNLADNISGHIAYVNADTLQYEFVNAMFEKSFGIPRDKIIGSHIKDIIGEENYHFALKYIEKARSGEAVSYENTFNLVSGTRWAKVNYTPVIGQNGRVSSIVVLSYDITELKHTEQALRQNEEKFRNLFNNAGIAMFRTRLDGSEVLDVNEKFLDIVGKTRDETLGKPSVNLWADTKERDDMVRTLVANGRVTELEFKMLNNQGGVRNCITSLVLYREQGILEGSILDITERKQSEVNLLASKQELLEAQRIAHLGSWDLDLQTGKGNWSDESYRIFGFEPGAFEPTFNIFIASVHPEDRKTVGAYLPDLLSGKLSEIELDLRVIRPSGEERIVNVKLEVITDKNGKPFKLSGISLDITERKLAEEALRESREQFRKLIENSPLSMALVDSDGVIEYINVKAIETFGYLPQDIPNMEYWWVLAYPEKTYREEVIAQWMGLVGEALRQNREIEQREYRVTCKNGSVKVVAIWGVWIGDKLLVVFDDITERKKLEEQVLQTQKLEAIGTLAGGIAHDFNNLLQGVFGYISIAKLNAADKDKSIAALEQAEKALHMSVNLTTQLLTFSKGGKPVKKKMPLQAVIENSVKFALSGSSINYNINFDKGLWYVYADEGQVGQVIQNIVLNADQAMPVGGTILITAKNVQAPGTGIPNLITEGRYVEISIQDNGIGISEAYLPKIFDPYFTTKAKGSGLGLATCYSIIKNHGGFIHVSSKAGMGTTFHIYLPAVEAEAEIAKASGSPAFVRKGKILLMDDEEVIRDVAGKMIAALEHEVAFAEHGEAAIEKYKASMGTGSPFDIVILDLTIRGGMGGRETIERLLAVNPKIKAIVSSGYSDDAAVSDYQSYGFSACLSKPYKLDALRDALNKLMS